jgi:hypothetical protein
MPKHGPSHNEKTNTPKFKVYDDLYTRSLRIVHNKKSKKTNFQTEATRSEKENKIRREEYFAAEEIIIETPNFREKELHVKRNQNMIDASITDIKRKSRIEFKKISGKLIT